MCLAVLLYPVQVPSYVLSPVGVIGIATNMPLLEGGNKATSGLQMILLNQFPCGTF
jgi:hypothetical protein